MSEKKLAVLFPGIGYTCVKPLLYYTAQAAAGRRYEVLRLDYGEDVHTFRGRTEMELLPVLRFLMTPIPPTIPWLYQIQGCFLAGTGDPYILREVVQKAASEYPDKVGAIFEGCNHSLEKPGDVNGNIRNLQLVIEKLEELMDQEG